MATLTIQLQSALGTSTKTLTFSAADATRIMSAYRALQQPGGTQGDLADFISGHARQQLLLMVRRHETTTPTDPVMT